MNTKIRKKTLILLVFLAAVSLLAYALNWKSLDGLAGITLPFIFRDTTRYSATYNDALYTKLKIGDDRRSVVRTIGEPLNKFARNHRSVWSYTESKSDSHYRIRQLEFRDDTLVNKVHYYSID
jgi:hypothetical protein